MRTLTESIAFWIGFTIGIILSLTLNIIDYKEKYDGLCMDCDNDFGLPFKVFQSGSLIQPEKVLWFGFLADIIILGLLSVCLGFIAHLIWNKFKIKAMK